MRLPTFYLPHGAGPCFFMAWGRGPADTWDRTAAYMRGLLARLPERPRAILVISGHWEAAAFTVGSAPRPELIFDYYGFPPHTYELTYPAAGDPALAADVVRRLRAAGFAAEADAERGWDHGVFIPLLLVAPEADIPVIQLSLRHDLHPTAHLAVGQALAGLRDEGVLIVGSGMSWHNMRGFSPAYTDRSARFHDWLEGAISDPLRRDAALAAWDEAPCAREAHPREEHLLPLMVAAGAARGEAGRVAFKDIAMDVVIAAVEFGEAP